jgi:hypothetical protein
MLLLVEWFVFWRWTWVFWKEGVKTYLMTLKLPLNSPTFFHHRITSMHQHGQPEVRHLQFDSKIDDCNFIDIFALICDATSAKSTRIPFCEGIPVHCTQLLCKHDHDQEPRYAQRVRIAKEMIHNTPHDLFE